MSALVLYPFDPAEAIRVSEAAERAGKSGGAKTEALARAAIEDLGKATEAIRARVLGGGARSTAAKKAADTRQRDAAKRSAAAKKAAATRKARAAKPR